MQEIDTIDSAIANDPFINMPIPPIGIDMRRIIIALRKEIPKRKIVFSANYRGDVFIPTLKKKIIMIPHENHLIVSQYKKIKLPLLLEEDLLDMKIVDIIVAWIESRNVNIKLEL